MVYDAPTSNLHPSSKQGGCVLTPWGLTASEYCTWPTLPVLPSVLILRELALVGQEEGFDGANIPAAATAAAPPEEAFNDALLEEDTLTSNEVSRLLA
jgi:hypothetical protein